MINERSIQTCDNSNFGVFKKPLYDSYCFSRIPQTIRGLLTGNLIDQVDGLPNDTIQQADCDFVLVILIDSFGWQYFEKFSHKYPFLKRFIDEGVVSKITSQFPSTTTNHVTCMHTGLSVAQSGIYDWFYYEPLVDSCICPLHFSYANDKEFNTLAKDGLTAADLFPFRTIYQDFDELGIRSVAFQNKNTSKSPYSQEMYKGAEIVGYNNLSEGLAKLLHKLNGQKQKSYYFFYFGDIDSAGHEFGPNSPEVAKQIDKCFSRLEKFWQDLTAKNRNGCFILTADHGMAQINPATTYYINKLLPGFERFIQRNKKGELLIPAGSRRDMFLHIKNEHLQEAFDALTIALKGLGQVHKTSDLIEEGLFGPISNRFLERVGNLVLLPFGENSIWWHDPNREESLNLGYHGGLTEAEVETIFLFQLLQNK